jgi:hypothetical protein
MSLPKRNAIHYDSRVFERVDWSHRGAYMEQRHGITPEVANDALGDVNRVVIDPNYNTTTPQCPDHWVFGHRRRDRHGDRAGG